MNFLKQLGGGCGGVVVGAGAFGGAGLVQVCFGEDNIDTSEEVFALRFSSSAGGVEELRGGALAL